MKNRILVRRNRAGAQGGSTQVKKKDQVRRFVSRVNDIMILSVSIVTVLSHYHSGMRICVNDVQVLLGFDTFINVVI